MKKLISIVLVSLAFLSCSHASKQESGKDADSLAKAQEAQTRMVLYPFSEGVAAFRKGEESRFINSKGETVIDIACHDASVFSEKLAAVKLVNKWGYVNHKGKFVINPQFDGACDFSEGLACVKKDKLWGYIDKKGRLVNENPRFLLHRPF
jgi:hypothetical protein